MTLLSTNPILCKIKYINRESFETTMGIGGVLGKAFHTAMNVYYGGSDVLIPTNESEAVEYGLRAGMEFLQDYNDGFIEYSTTVPNKQKALEILTFAFQEYIKNSPYKADEVVSTEEKIEEYIHVEWRGKELKLPVKLKGYLDKIERTDGKLKIRDYKLVHSYSDGDKIDGAKMLQAVEYYLLAYAKYGEEPYSCIFDEVKRTKNIKACTDSECKMQHDKNKVHTQVQSYEIVFAENDLYFDFYFRFYEDTIRALNGEMVYFPNVHAIFDNEVSIIAYIHRLDVSEHTAKLMKKHKVETLSELLKKEIQSAGNMRKLLKAVEDKFVSAKNIDYEKMPMEEKIQTKMLEYGIMLQFDSKVEGATVDLYRYMPSIGVKMSRIRNFVDDVEQVTGKSGIRILAPIPNSKLVGFEIPKDTRVFPSLPEDAQGFKLAIGQMLNGETRYFDVREAPHLLVAGSAGSGKSVFLHSLIRQLVKLPNVDLHLFDPKQVEFLQYEEIVSDYKHSASGIAIALKDLVSEMERRYTFMKKQKVKNISEISEMPYIFVVIDEYADLKVRQEVDASIKLLAQKGRACGIHLIVATQRASTKVIDGDIKVNFPVKVVFRMSKSVDSRVMIDEEGAEKLLGKGDCLFQSDAGVERLQAFNL